MNRSVEEDSLINFNLSQSIVSCSNSEITSLNKHIYNLALRINNNVWGIISTQKAETQKDPFPHYFYLEDPQSTLSYVGPLPEYKYFESKRTSPKDYKEMQTLFENKPWSFLEVSSSYIMGDCVALYQVLLAYFDTLVSKFPINPLELYGQLDWSGSLPEYKYFEPKRTSPSQYQEMVDLFRGTTWSFLDVSRSYIMGDCKALYQVLISFFETIVSKFPIDPLSVLSAPSTAFKIWRTVQLPLLNKNLLAVFDFSRSLDAKFREAYHGGIVDVYKPHLIGEGYYYDVNSLYPAAMCKAMPVGMPSLVKLTPDEFINGDFFGFLEVYVQAPDPTTPGGYIGLLPLKLGGRLVCPGGVFSGFFFSEELRFALANGYTLLSIGLAYSFQRGVHTFLELIQQLNRMKIEAQLNNQPTIRNIAKLLMNSMYGRFGMHTDAVRHAFLEDQQIIDLAKHFLIKGQVDLGALSLVTYTLSQQSIHLGTKPDQKVLSKFREGLPGNTNVAIAAAVTAYSQMIINSYKLRALELGLEIYYSDTDSLVTNGQLPSDLIDSATLGMLKLEYKFKEGIFVMPKVYYLELDSGKVVTKCKGYPGRLTKDQYLDLLSGNSLDLLVTKWVRSLRNSTIQILRNTPYTITFSFNKRAQILDSNSNWVDTRPIILKGT